MYDIYLYIYVYHICIKIYIYTMNCVSHHLGCSASERTYEDNKAYSDQAAFETCCLLEQMATANGP